MAMEVNGGAILAAMARAPTAFGMNVSQLNALAMSTMIGKMKDKAVGLDIIRAMRQTIGQDDFALTVDHMSAKDAAALAKRLDPRHPDLKGAGDSWLREQVVKLAEGQMEPTVVQSRGRSSTASATPRTRVPKTGAIMKSKALRPRNRKAQTAAEE